MLLTVIDDGVGADPAKLAAAQGRGLDLLRQRLKHLYGEDASVGFATSSGEGFRVTVRIPTRPDREDEAGMGDSRPTRGRATP